MAAMTSVASLSSGSCYSSPVSRSPSGVGSGQNLLRSSLAIKSAVPRKLKTLHGSSQRRIVAAAAAGEDAGAHSDSVPSMDRRELLAGTVAGGMSLIGAADPVHAAPVGDPNFKTCGPADVNMGPSKQIFVACCPPKPKRATIEFKPDTGPMRVRPAAHLVDEDYIAKYNEAYAKMRALPADDPRSFRQQANVHCAYCNFGYRQEGDSKSKLQIHFSWLFLPWHRWYLYFHEKILGSLINDPTFALPFWNWDNQEGGSLIPEMFLREGTAIYDDERNHSNYPPQLVNLNFVPGPPPNPPPTPEEIKKINLNVMKQNVATVKDPVTFFGGYYRKGENPVSSDGTLEKAPHTAVHVFGGKPSNPFGEDLGNFYSAGKDPLFYSHHGNVDRCWEVWRSLGNSDFTDPDYLNTEFLFFDENADLVRCKVKDCLDPANTLKSSWVKVPQDEQWINYQPLPLAQTAYAQPPPTAAGVVASLVPGMAALAADYPELGPNSGVTELKGNPLTVSVAQPKDGKGKTDEILTLQGLEVPMGTNTTFEVFINLPGATEKTVVDCAEYVGSFYNIPHFMPGMTEAMTRTTNARFSIRSNIQTLGLTDASKITVTVVPKGKDKEVGFKFKGVNIEYTA